MKTFLLLFVSLSLSILAAADSPPAPPPPQDKPSAVGRTYTFPPPLNPPTIESLQAELALDRAELALVRAQLNQLDLEFGQMVKSCNDPGLIVAKAITIQSGQRSEELKAKLAAEAKTAQVKAQAQSQSKAIPDTTNTKKDK